QQRDADAQMQQVRVGAGVLRLLPRERFLFPQQLRELRAVLGPVTVNYRSGHADQFRGLERVTEEQREKRRQDEDEREDALVAPYVEEFLQCHAGDGVPDRANGHAAWLSRSSVKPWDQALKTSSMSG